MKKQLQEIFLDYVNNFISLSGFAKHYALTPISSAAYWRLSFGA